MQNSKMKTLLIYKFFEEYSDEENPLSSSDLISILAEKGVTCERKSIYADIKALNEIGCEIVSTSYPKKGYYMSSRRFQVPEVRLLIDAVNSAGFITPAKTKSLTEKLESLVSSHQADDLISQVYCENKNKCDNEEIYYLIDNLYDAISKRRMVRFTYRRRNIDKETKKSYTNRIFTVSPYALIWKDGHYYLVCNKSKYDNLMNLRVDRIRKLEILDETIRHFSEVSEYKFRFDTADYASKMFNMFSGKTEEVTLVCHLELREEMMDRFGPNIPLSAVDENHFETKIQAAVSDGFVSWIMQYGDRMKVVAPQHMIDKIKCKAYSVLSNYKTLM